MEEQATRRKRGFLRERFRGANIYRKGREKRARIYLKRSTGIEDSDSIVSWQPLPYVLLKVVIAAVILVSLYILSPVLGGWLEKGFRFFKLHEIYSFTFPSRSFFDTVARGLVLLIELYYGGYFCYHQLLALCSTLVMSARVGKLCLIKSILIRKEVHVMSTHDLDLVVLKQNLLSRVLGIATLVVTTRNGIRLTIRGLTYAPALMKGISSQSDTGRTT
jgi:hypothetical protein